MAAGEVDHPAVERGIGHLISTQKPDGTWVEDYYTAVGFPRVFYLRYHGYKAYFRPNLGRWQRYRNLTAIMRRRLSTGCNNGFTIHRQILADLNEKSLRRRGISFWRSLAIFVVSFFVVVLIIIASLCVAVGAILRKSKSRAA